MLRELRQQNGRTRETEKGRLERAVHAEAYEFEAGEGKS